MANQLPETGFLRLAQIIGDGERAPIIPVKKSAWWAGVKDGRYPPAVKLSSRVTVWRVEDIRSLVDGRRPWQEAATPAKPARRRAPAPLELASQA